MVLPVKLTPGNPVVTDGGGGGGVGGGGVGEPVDELEPQPENAQHRAPTPITLRTVWKLRNMGLTGS
jgi:hypothetical protein